MFHLVNGSRQKHRVCHWFRLVRFQQRGGKKSDNRGQEILLAGASASPEGVTLVIILQLVLLVVSQLSVAELPVHGTILTHVDNVLVIVLVLVLVPYPPQTTLSDVDQAALLGASAGGAGVAAVGRGGS